MRRGEGDARMRGAACCSGVRTPVEVKDFLCGTNQESRDRPDPGAFARPPALLTSVPLCFSAPQAPPPSVRCRMAPPLTRWTSREGNAHPAGPARWPGAPFSKQRASLQYLGPGLPEGPTGTGGQAWPERRREPVHWGFARVCGFPERAPRLPVLRPSKQAWWCPECWSLSVNTPPPTRTRRQFSRGRGVQ